MKEIQLSKGKITLVDDEDYQYLNQWKWYSYKIGNSYYSHAVIKYKTVIMHRLIMNCPTNLVIDHIDHDGLNNQKSNLRICTQRQNTVNRMPFGKSKYKGVYFDGNRIRAIINYNNKKRYLGSFKNEMDAAKAYDEAAKKHHGEFAYLNFK